MPIRVRDDSRWSVSEPELALVVNSRLGIVGYRAGNDVSSRDLEGGEPALPAAGEDLRRITRARPRGALLMTGTGIVPPLEFSLQKGGLVRVVVGALTLENAVLDSGHRSREY